MRIIIYSVLFLLICLNLYAQEIKKIDAITYQETVVVEKTIDDLTAECRSYQPQVDSLQIEIDRRQEQLKIIQDLQAECEIKSDSVKEILAQPIKADATADINWPTSDMIGN